MSKLSAFYHTYLSRLNKYKYGVVIVFFTVITFVTGDCNLYKRYSYDEKIRELEKEIKQYQKEIAANQKKLNDLRSNKEWVERYAREEYHMKKANEDVFIITEK